MIDSIDQSRTAIPTQDQCRLQDVGCDWQGDDLRLMLEEKCFDSEKKKSGQHVSKYQTLLHRERYAR